MLRPRLPSTDVQDSKSATALQVRLDRVRPAGCRPQPRSIFRSRSRTADTPPNRRWAPARRGRFSAIAPRFREAQWRRECYVPVCRPQHLCLLRRCASSVGQFAPNQTYDLHCFLQSATWRPSEVCIRPIWMNRSSCGRPLTQGSVESRLTSQLNDSHCCLEPHRSVLSTTRSRCLYRGTTAPARLDPHTQSLCSLLETRRILLRRNWPSRETRLGSRRYPRSVTATQARVASVTKPAMPRTVSRVTSGDDST